MKVFATTIRKQFKPDFRAKVAIETRGGDKFTAEGVQIFGVHVTQISAWKLQLLESASSVFEGKRPPSPTPSTSTSTSTRSESLRQSATLLRRGPGHVPSEERRRMIDAGPQLPVSIQDRLLSPALDLLLRRATESPEKLTRTAIFDRFNLPHPESGSRMMVRVLKRTGHVVNRKRV